MVPAAEIRALREELPSNLAILCNKLVDRLQMAAENSCQTQRDQTAGKENLEKCSFNKVFLSLLPHTSSDQLCSIAHSSITIHIRRTRMARLFLV